MTPERISEYLGIDIKVWDGKWYQKTSDHTQVLCEIHVRVRHPHAWEQMKAGAVYAVSVLNGGDNPCDKCREKIAQDSSMSVAAVQPAKNVGNPADIPSISPPNLDGTL